MRGLRLVENCFNDSTSIDFSKSVEKRRSSAQSAARPQWTTLLSSDDVPHEFRELYITQGYRPPGLSFRDCARSLFQWHNETSNVWTHVGVTSVYFLILGYLQTTRTVDFLVDSYALPLLAVILGSAVCTLMSCVAHLFNCMSMDVRHVCFYFDYAGVTMLGLTTSIGYYYYSRLRGLGFTDSPSSYLGLLVVTCSVACYLACASRHQWKRARYVVRMIAFSVPYAISLTPLFQRMLYVKEWEPVLSMYLLHIPFVVGGSIINALKLPERLQPGMFNYNGHSHCLMHVLCGIGTFIQIAAMAMDMKAKRDVLVQEPSLTVSKVFGPIATLLLVQALIIRYFCYKLLGSRREKADRQEIIQNEKND